jgi:SAM-dependent methyltransferase
MEFAVSDRDSLRFLAHSYYFSCALFVAVRLDLAGALADEPKSASRLARELGTNSDVTVRFLQFLASIGVLIEDQRHRFALSNTGQYLRMDHANSIAKEISMFSGGEVYRAWGELLQTIKTGKPAFEILNGEPLFSYLAGHPESAERFHLGWQEISVKVGKEVVEVYDFTTVKTVTDVGGGYGIFLATILQHLKNLDGVLFDLPFSVRGAEETFRKWGVEDHVTVLTGNAEDHVPPTQLCILKSVIHGCVDERAQRILSNCFEALPADGKILLLERVIPENSGYHWSRLVDMTMMVMTGGMERSLEQYETMYARSGFRLSRCLDLPSGFSIIEGSKT